MEAERYIGKILADGHLSIPKKIAVDVGKVFEVILIPIENIDIYSFTEQISNEKGFNKYSEKDIEEIIHKSRGIID